MPRTGRRSLSIAAAVIAMLAAPAAAQAVTYTVKPNDGPCSAADTACGSLAFAADAAAAGDVFNISPATYGSATFDVEDVTLTGVPNFIVNGSLAFTGNGLKPAKVQHLALTQPNGTAAGIISTGTAGLEISDSVVFGVSGDGVTFSEGVGNKIVRSVVVTGGTETSAVHITSADLSTAGKKLLAESSLLSGGLNALSVNTGQGNGLVSAAGPIDVILRHVTLAGSSQSLVLDASKANPLIGGPVGNITASVTDSLVEKAVVKKNYPGVVTGLVITAPPNTVTYTPVRTMEAFDPGTVFENPAKRNFRLKAGSPAIDQGGFTEGESATDVDSQARPGPTTDLGADEYYPPPAAGTGPAPTPLGAQNDGDLPKVVITRPKANETIHLTTKTTKTTTLMKDGKPVMKDGKPVKVKKTTTKKNKFPVITGTASDKSGIKGVVLTIEKTKAAASAKAAAATTAKCRWFNATKGIVLKSCAKPIVLLAKLATDGTWTYKIKSTLRLSAGKYRIITAALDKSGAFGNGAPIKDAVHSFTIVK